MFEREECTQNGCTGCLGVTWSCGHTYSCRMDPKSINHRCAAEFNNALFALLMGISALLIGLSIAGRL